MSKYDIGYKKPPKQHQFKKGKSGNPLGRKKTKAKSVLQLIEEILSEKVTVTENGTSFRISILEAMVKRAAQAGLKGNFRPFADLKRLFGDEKAADTEPFEFTLKLGTQKVDIQNDRLLPEEKTYIKVTDDEP